MHPPRTASLALATLAALALAGLAAPAARAQSLVANPGFEAGDFSGWDVTGGAALVTNDLPHSGTYAALFGAAPPDLNTLSQTLSTVAGTPYTISFWVETPALAPPGSPNTFDVFFGDALVPGSPGSVPDDAQYHLYTLHAVATAASTPLRFAVSNTNDFTALDDVRVAAVPEPGPLALLTLGLLGLAGVARRRRPSARS